MPKKTKYMPLLAFLLNFAIAYCVFHGYMAANNGLLTMSNDFDAQELAFNVFAIRSVKSGQVFFNWAIDIGSEFIPTFGFYNLGSPFFWLAALFPAKMFPYLMGWLFMLKYAVAGLFSCLYLQKHVSGKWALAGSVMYAFCSYQATNLVFYHFHDVVAFFPLLLWGLETMLETRRAGIFAFTVGINCLVNWNFFFGELIFIIVYYIVRFDMFSRIREKKYKETFGEVLWCLGEGMLGAGMAAIILVPSVIGVMGNSRVANIIRGEDAITFESIRMLTVIKAMFFPGDIMSHQSMLETENWYSSSAWIPLMGLGLVFGWLIAEKKHWSARLAKVLFLFACLPLLNSTFMLLNEEPYRRWLYMFVLICVLCSCLALERMESDKEMARCLRIGTILNLVAVSILSLFLWGWKGYYPSDEYYVKNSDGEWELAEEPREMEEEDLGERWTDVQWRKYNEKKQKKYIDKDDEDEEENLSFINAKRPAIKYTEMALACAAGGVVVVLLLSKNKIAGYLALLCGIAYAGGYNSWYNILRYKYYRDYEGKDLYNELLNSLGTLDADIIPYRYELENFYYDLNMATMMTTVNSFISTVDGGIFEFYEAVGHPRLVCTEDGPLGTNELLSVKYWIYEGIQPEREEAYLVHYNGYHDHYTYEDPYALPIGFTYDSYILASELEDVPEEYKALVLMKALAVDDEMEDQVADVLKHYAYRKSVLTKRGLHMDMDARRKNSSTNFKHSTTGVECDIFADQEEYAFFSIPYSWKWHAWINGEEREILPSAGMIALRLEEGENHIEIKFDTTIYKVSAVVSLASAGLIAMLALKSGRVKE